MPDLMFFHNHFLTIVPGPIEMEHPFCYTGYIEHISYSRKQTVLTMSTISADDLSPLTGDTLNVAATCTATRALGPGLRAALWVQGCCFRCPGCIAPEWTTMRPERLAAVDALAGELLSDPLVEGITISGGEPMLQAASLARLCRVLRSRRDLNIICFTGFQYEQLLHTPPGPGVDEFLSTIDLLIDGPYIERLNTGAGLRGSENQRFIHLTGRLKDVDFASQPRKTEIRLMDGSVQMIGIPTLRLREAFHQAVDQANRLGLEMFHYERV
jgi:anaerobic ribonucleoside-triphosphate reductase activating protein